MDIATIIAQERLPDAYAQVVERWWRPLAQQIAQWREDAGRPIVVGVNGGQGSGKSTLCRFLEAALLPDLGLKAVTLALDDLYLTLAERVDLARNVHPLLRTRGVPGTHDATLGCQILDDLLAGRPVLIPRFSKGMDDRLPQQEWHRVTGGVDVILFEGWCVGTRAQQPDDLKAPVNDLEAEQDPDGLWRRHVNAQLAGPYAQWFSRLDRLVMLKAPSFESVFANRLLQEQKLQDTLGADRAQVDEGRLRNFVKTYERLTRAMMALETISPDIIVALGERHEIREVRGRA